MKILPIITLLFLLTSCDHSNTIPVTIFFEGRLLDEKGNGLENGSVYIFRDLDESFPKHRPITNIYGNFSIPINVKKDHKYSFYVLYKKEGYSTEFQTVSLLISKDTPNMKFRHKLQTVYS